MKLNTKDTIVQVAGNLFAKYGFYKTSMDEVAKVARKAKGSLYYHFRSKEDLFKEVLARELESVKSGLSEVVKEHNGANDRLIFFYLKKRMELLSKAEIYHEALKADLNERFSFLDDVRTQFSLWEKNFFKNIIQKGIEEGVVDPKLNLNMAVEVFFLISKNTEISFFVQNRFEEFAPHFDDLIEILIKGIRP
ncbi:MAG TPA: TetR/AcrR family transcriptional regulator [Bacteroidales bacterium]|nr:TetR/AcrR family transcriptional regulator [Bacteroidales bacterium]HQB75292.1 TetR/AcrR family transcriptional regulator [Bacteroidales bacterium]